ncbi:zinc metalloproteinase dpy-31 [Ditylenchus destructor]|nr:zinc metalloproteinase dpy-31 [Ditylenchus destructor]
MFGSKAAFWQPLCHGNAMGTQQILRWKIQICLERHRLSNKEEMRDSQNTHLGGGPYGVDSLSAEIDNEAEGTTKSTTSALEDLKIGVITRKPLLRARQFASGLVKILDGDTFEKDVGKQRNDIEDDVTLKMNFESWTTETSTSVATSDSQVTLEQSIIPTNEPFTTENQLACSNSTSGSEKGNQWLEWSAWTACTDECGACGTHSRSRLCLTNHPGCVCIGPSLEIEKCNRNFCSYPRNTCCAGLRAKSVNGTFMCIELTKISELV